MSYVPMDEYEVKLRVHVPRGESSPAEWDWADLTDMVDDDIQFTSQQVVKSYNRDLA